MLNRPYHGPDRDNPEYHCLWPVMNEGQDDYYEMRRQNRDEYPALPFRGQQFYPKRRPANNQKKQFESYLRPRRQSAQIQELLSNSEPILKPKVVQPIHQDDAKIPDENKPSLKGNLKVDGTPTATFIPQLQW